MQGTHVAAANATTPPSRDTFCSNFSAMLALSTGEGCYAEQMKLLLEPGVDWLWDVLREVVALLSS